MKFFMPVIIRQELQDYINQNSANLRKDENDARNTYQEMDSWLKENPGRISATKFERYLNEEMNWFIDCARHEKRSSGRIRNSTKRIVYDSKSVLYKTLKDFNLSRTRNY